MSNFRPKGWWIPYIKSGVGQPSLSKVFLNFLKDFYYVIVNLVYSILEFVLQKHAPTEWVESVSDVLSSRGINL